MPFWRKRTGTPDPKPLLAQARALLADGDLDQAIERFDEYAQARPDDDAAWAELARALVKAERIEEAVDIVADLPPSLPLALLAKGEALAAHGDFEPALEALAKARDWYEHEIRTNFQGEYARNGFHEASQLFDLVYGELHGGEQVVVDHATRGQLDARAGVNYQLLGNSLMVDSEHEPDVLEIESLEEMTARLEEMSTSERRDVPGLLLEGTIALREGWASDAVTVFQQAVELDGKHFAAFRGLGIAMRAVNHNLVRGADRLPMPDARGWTGLESVVVDLPALTPIERKIVLCSIHPLRRALPVLAAAGTTIRIMPLDVRTTDYEPFADRGDARTEGDQRSLRAVSGVAGHGLALVRIDELFELAGHKSWVFGHEFAHLAQGCLAAKHRARITELFERAVASGYVNSEYARRNEYEFFAEHYTHGLMERHELPHTRLEDDRGVADGMRALLAEIATDEGAFVAPG